MNLSLFHESWWLSAASDGRAEEVVVESGGQIVGRLPYVTVTRGPLRALRMPPLTHVLGPVVEAGEGKPQTRLNKRLSLVRALIDKLPPHAYFHQHLDPGLDDGLAVAEALRSRKGLSKYPRNTHLRSIAAARCKSCGTPSI